MVTKLELTGGETPFDAGDPRTWPAGFSAFEDELVTDLAGKAESSDVRFPAGADIVDADIGAAAAIALSKLATDPLARANHTGSQAISTVTGLQDELDDKLSDVPASTPIYLVELTEGVWSGDLPSRTLGDRPAVMVGLSDPADSTNGIDTPANINERDRWIELASL